MGAVGRFSVGSGQEKGEDELLLDLKGIVYKTTIVPSNTFFVVNVLQTEAKVEAIMSDFMQLRPDIHQVKDETVVEGTLEDFAFDLDNDGEPLSTPVTAGVESDADEDTKQKKNLAKLQKVKKTSATKGGKGSRAKGSGKGNATSKKPRAKVKGGTSKKPSKPKLTGGQKVKKKI